ncbi:hypothetical protein [Streptomyces showdoensis]|uniref:Uncharacterized protein n=1 Tax=Streptomyces showdoensis TaxID=68268 RepID=A0A2P2GS77_STREW|nr:hypothetical protein [Streptomyces showdoensis]KKZ74338.1 hypothetical protein VO63_07780 [Streptomyces showdoensis]
MALFKKPTPTQKANWKARLTGSTQRYSGTVDELKTDLRAELAKTTDPADKKQLENLLKLAEQGDVPPWIAGGNHDPNRRH